MSIKIKESWHRFGGQCDRVWEGLPLSSWMPPREPRECLQPSLQAMDTLQLMEWTEWAKLEKWLNGCVLSKLLLYLPLLQVLASEKIGIPSGSDS